MVARILLAGVIVEGDADRLRKEIDEIAKEAAAANSVCYVNDGVNSRLIYVSMQSPGGLYSEGWKIAKLFGQPETIAATYVGDSNSCYSACAIAFLGGSAPGAEGSIIIKRAIHPTAKLGFHAPFPLLKEKSYTSEDIIAFFLSAFAVSHEFVTDAKSLGIEPEVAQLMLQPTPDQFYDIDSVGRALLTGITVTQREFTFSVYGADPGEITNQNVVNLCFNNAIVKAKGDTSSFFEFLKHGQAASFIPVRTSASYFGRDNIPAEAFIVPVADAGEGEVLSCVVVVAQIPSTENENGGTKFACLGFEYGSESLAEKITQMGTDWIWRDRPEAGCALSSSILALERRTFS